MNADHALVTGYTHHVCQDYIRNGLDYYGRPFVVLADGCSGSKFTDTGARLLVHTAHDFTSTEEIPTLGDALNEAIIIASRALDRADDLYLPSECCDATLLSIRMEPDGGAFRTTIFGDGVFVGSKKNFGLVIKEVNFESDCGTASWPNYPVYQLQASRRQILLNKISESGLRKIIKTTGYGTSSVAPALDFNLTHFTGPTNGWDWAAIFSDGIQTFRRPIGELGQYEAVPILEVIEKLCDFKNMKGQFVQRRLNRFLKDVTKLGWKHEDDISMGVINFK